MIAESLAARSPLTSRVQIINNYGGSGLDPSPYPSAANAFKLYNGAANYDSPALGDHYYNFTHGDVAFFVMDTRRYRSDIETVPPLERTMLGEKQLEAFNSWLAKVRFSVAFLIFGRLIVVSLGQQYCNVQVHRLICAVQLSMGPRRGQGLVGWV